MTPKRRLLEPHEREILIASEIRRQFHELPLAARNRIRRDLAREIIGAIAEGAAIAILLTAALLSSSSIVSLAVPAGVIAFAMEFRTKCLTGKYARMSGIAPLWRYPEVTAKDAMSQLRAGAR